jgi:hypothetical protein
MHRLSRVTDVQNTRPHDSAWKCEIGSPRNLELFRPRLWIQHAHTPLPCKGSLSLIQSGECGERLTEGKVIFNFVV